jgi:two-component sensor histidine kinase
MSSAAAPFSRGRSRPLSQFPPIARSIPTNVTVQITMADRELSLAVSNNGDTLPADFDFAVLPSIRLKLVTNLVEKLNGTLKIECGQWTTFKLYFSAKK